ncbi:Uncharacterised protein [Enterobacter cloacae]|nr:Uncharacterised protein [Enterobacter cloacae]
MGFDLFVHQGFNFEGVHVAADDQPQVIDDKIEHHRVSQNTRVAGENFALFRVFNVPLQREHSLLT